ncbi:MAG: hypothetical protein ACRDPC_00110 [Solirubrobacteraceae bacterium]
MALAAIAAVVLVGVSVHEFDYAADHPYRYGPAKVIAWTAGAGALLAIAVGLLAGALLRQGHSSS